MGKKVSRTTFVTRGRIAGLIRDEAPAVTGQNRTTRSANVTYCVEPGGVAQDFPSIPF